MSGLGVGPLEMILVLLVTFFVFGPRDIGAGIRVTVRAVRDVLERLP